MAARPAICPQGGAVAQLPTGFALSDCAGTGFNQAQGVAACSYLRGPPAGLTGDTFWLAGPWFTGRFCAV